MSTLLYKGAEAVCDLQAQLEINSAIFKLVASNILANPDIHIKFTERYREWILSTRLNVVKGLDQFPVVTYSNGTTESFDKFYLKHNSRRLRIFKGEYMYHIACGKHYFSEYTFLDEEKVKKNDVVVISLPFSDLGEEHPETISILNQCLLLNVPVLIDCAFFGMCREMDFDFTHPAISEITFSLSKFLPVSHLRIGARFSKVDDDDALLINHKHGYINRLGAGVGLYILNTYTPDYNVIKYIELQEEFCKTLNIRPSKSVIFGIDETNQYPEYNRGYVTNRLCFSQYLNDQQLPT